MPKIRYAQFKVHWANILIYIFFFDFETFFIWPLSSQRFNSTIKITTDFNKFHFNSMHNSTKQNITNLFNKSTRRIKIDYNFFCFYYFVLLDFLYFRFRFYLFLTKFTKHRIKCRNLIQSFAIVNNQTICN